MWCNLTNATQSRKNEIRYFLLIWCRRVHWVFKKKINTIGWRFAELEQFEVGSTKNQIVGKSRLKWITVSLKVFIFSILFKFVISSATIYQIELGFRLKHA